LRVTVCLIPTFWFDCPVRAPCYYSRLPYPLPSKKSWWFSG